MKIGNGTAPYESRCTIANIANACSTFHQLVSSVYPEFPNNYKNRDWLRERAILAPTNATVNQLNEQMMAMIEGESVTYKSVDSHAAAEDAVYYPTEFLNSLQPSGWFYSMNDTPACMQQEIYISDD